ncbi:MAG: hypothetical protein NC820_07715 [Candidatus Omnitrophica bacterium]|nr:hypothetical protein [Candidatus Omnitrophota bacterium]
MELTIKLLGVFLGVLARTLLPYIRKVKQGKVKKFWRRYGEQAFASLILGIITTFLIFPQFNIDKPGVGLEASIKLFCLSFAFGFGCNSMVSEAIKWTEKNNAKK